jgi:hypothetical protein
MSKKHRLMTLSHATRLSNIIRVDWGKTQMLKNLFPEVDTSEIKTDGETMVIPIRIAREIVKHHQLT